MKKLIPSIILLFILSSCGINETTEIYINSTYTQTQVDSVIAVMEEENVEVEFTKLKYESGKIKEISGSIESGIQEGSFSSENFHYLKIKVENTNLEIEIE